MAIRLNNDNKTNPIISGEKKEKDIISMEDPLGKYKIKKEEGKNTRSNSFFNLREKKRGHGMRDYSNEEIKDTGTNGNGNGDDVNVIDPIDNTGGKF